MEKKKFVLTREGMQKMEEELILLKTVKRREVAQKIKEARAAIKQNKNNGTEEKGMYL